jgi:hypothetical protein
VARSSHPQPAGFLLENCPLGAIADDESDDPAPDIPCRAGERPDQQVDVFPAHQRSDGTDNEGPLRYPQLVPDLPARTVRPRRWVDAVVHHRHPRRVDPLRRVGPPKSIGDADHPGQVTIYDPGLLRSQGAEASRVLQ